ALVWLGLSRCALEVVAGELWVAADDQLGQADVGVGGLVVAVERLEDRRLQLERGDVARVADEHRVEVSERVLEHLVLDVDADLEEQLVDVADVVLGLLGGASARFASTPSKGREGRSSTSTSSSRSVPVAAAAAS